jgi:hypothetical protein
MASKTVWIVGGIVVVLGAVLYVTFKEGPANTSATGTIVEAKRARADGTNSVNPTPTASTTEQSSDASKGMAGPDAAKDAAAAAGGSGDNKRTGGGQTLDAIKHASNADALDAASAAGGGAAQGHNPAGHNPAVHNPAGHNPAAQNLEGSSTSK